VLAASAALIYLGALGKAALLDLPEDAGRLAAFLKSSPAADAIFPAAISDQLLRDYDLQPRAAHGALLHAVVSPKSAPRRGHSPARLPSTATGRARLTQL